MPHTRLHEKLLELPLFQGMSRNDLEQVATSTKFRHLAFILHEPVYISKA